MVKYIENFIPLSEEFSYETIEGTPIYQSEPHQVQIGWMRCPCKPVDGCPKKYDNWGPTAYKIEIWNCKDTDNDVAYKIGFLHQTPILLVKYQTVGSNSVFNGLVFDSNGILSKSTLSAWQEMITKLQLSNILSEDWAVISRRTKDGRGYKKKEYLLVNTRHREEYIIRDGLTIEYSDIFLDWLGI